MTERKKEISPSTLSRNSSGVWLSMMMRVFGKKVVC